LVKAGHSHIIREKLRKAYLYEYETGERLESRVEQSLVSASVGVHDKLGHQPWVPKGEAASKATARSGNSSMGGKAAKIRHLASFQC
jgi:hypothetical protein